MKPAPRCETCNCLCHCNKIEHYDYIGICECKNCQCKQYDECETCQ